jgi:hypothetical protein
MIPDDATRAAQRTLESGPGMDDSVASAVVAQLTIPAADASTWRMVCNAQVRKTPSWPRSWANFSLLWLYSYRNAWTNLHFLGQPNTFLVIRGGRAALRSRPGGSGKARIAMDAQVICAPPCIFH